MPSVDSLVVMFISQTNEIGCLNHSAEFGCINVGTVDWNIQQLDEWFKLKIIEFCLFQFFTLTVKLSITIESIILFVFVAVCIRVWMTEDCMKADDAEVIVRWDVNFSSLVPLEKEVGWLVPNEFSQIMDFHFKNYLKNIWSVIYK